MIVLEVITWVLAGVCGLAIVAAFFGMLTIDSYDIHAYKDASPPRKPSTKPPRDKDPLDELPRAWLRRRS